MARTILTVNLDILAPSQTFSLSQKKSALSRMVVVGDGDGCLCGWREEDTIVRGIINNVGNKTAPLG